MEVPVIQGYRLSPQQRRLWQVQRDRGAFFSQIAIRIEGELHRERLVRALEELVVRHEILRTVYRCTPGITFPVQLILASAAPMLEEVDLRGIEPAQQRACMADLLAGHRHRKIDLGASPVLFISLIRTADKCHTLLVSLPSLGADVRTLRNLMQQLAASYDRRANGAGVEEAPEPTQYTQFSEWQLQLLEEDEAASGASVWRRIPRGAVPLPFENGRVPASWAGEPSSFPVALSPELKIAAAKLASARGVSACTVLLVAWQVLMARFAGSREVTVAVLFEGRKYSELYDSFGLFAKWLPVRFEFAPGMQFVEALVRAQDGLDEAESWQEYFLPADGDVARAGFVFMEWPESTTGGGLSFAAEELRVEDEPIRLTLSCRSREGRLELALLFDSRIFAPEAINYLAARCVSLLTDALLHPTKAVEELDLLGAGERRRLLMEWSGSGLGTSGEELIHQIFAQQAARTPQAIAVLCGDERLTYGQLEARANQLARALLRRGARPEQPIGVMLERSLALVVSLLGILKAGAAYVPLDPSLPQERLDFLCADGLGESPLVVTEERFADRFSPQSVLSVDLEAAAIAGELTAAPEVSLEADTLAYVIYTSGSTGRPKGVAISHANVVRLFSATVDCFAFSSDDVWPLFHSYAFDLSVWEIFGALLYGGRLVVVPYEVSRSPDAFHALLARERVTVLTQTPTAFSQLIAAEEAGAAEDLALRLVIFGGEALNPASLAPWLARHGDAKPRLINMYGITETTVHTTLYRMSGADLDEPARSPIGRPLADTRLYVLEAALQPVPVGAVGELYVGGPGLARGYLGRPDLTAARFVPDMLSGEAGARLYRSGDLVSYRADGNLEYLGRMDNQVKVRGFRIELGEVEAALHRLPGVRRAVAVVKTDEPGEALLVAYLVPDSNAALPTRGDLRARLLELLPEYMVPTAFVPLSVLPLTPNGKIDRRALPPPEQARRDLRVKISAPQNELQRMIAKIWQNVLKTDDIGIHDSFFDLGGNSLRLFEMGTKLRQVYKGRRVELVELMRFPTIASLSEHLTAQDELPAVAQVDDRAAKLRQGRNQLTGQFERMRRVPR